MATKQEIESFHHFALQEVESGGAAPSMDELFHQWSSSRPTDRELAESVAAVKAAYADYLAGDTGRPVHEMMREACERHGLVVDGLDE